MATCSWDATVQVYDLGNDGEGALLVTLGEQPQANDPEIPPVMGGLYGVAFAWTEPGVLGCVSADNCAYLWNYTSGALLSRMEGHKDEVNGIVFHPSLEVFCTSSDDCTAILWDLKDGSMARTLTDHSKAVYGATFLGKQEPDLVATCCFDQMVRLWDMRVPKVVNALKGFHSNDIIGIDYADKTRLLATGSDDGYICIFDSRKWDSPLFRINSVVDPGIPNNEIKRCTFNPEGTKVAAGSSSYQVLIYDVSGPSPQSVASLTGHSDCVFDVAWGLDSKGREFLVDASHDHTSFVWRPRS
jgi:WD40 repeat protein